MTIDKHPLISIITVAFNAASTIEQTILSVINQTYPYIEYIIIDGGSTDETVNIIKKYSNRISYWVSEPDKGIYDAMNKGIKVATGEWINFMNVGDAFYNNSVIESIFYNKNYDKIDIIYGNTNLVYSFGSHILKGREISSNKYMPFCHQSSFSNVEPMKKYGFDIKFKICADKNYYYTLYNNNAKFKYLDITISNYEAESGVSAKNFPQVYYEIGVIEGKFHNRIWKLKYIIISLYCKILYFIKRKTPNNILQYIKKKKIFFQHIKH